MREPDSSPRADADVAAPVGAAPAKAAPDMDELARILQAFTDSTAQMQATQTTLLARVDELSGELQHKNAELSATLGKVSTLKNHLADVISNTVDAVLALDGQRRVVALNAAARELLERLGGEALPEEVEGRFVLDLAKGSARELAHLLMRALSERRRFAHVGFALADARGEKRLVEASAAPVSPPPSREDDHVPPAAETGGVVGTFRDLTDWRALEERARRQDRLAELGEMAAGVAHEIRNPLGGIELYASNLRRKLPEGSSERATCDKIIGAATHLNRIVSDLLSFTRDRETNLRPTPAAAPVRAALDWAGAVLGEHGVEVAFEDGTGSARFPLDPDLMTQAFLNVILNAAQAMGREPEGEGRRLWVRAFVETPDPDGAPDAGRPARRLVFVFEDNGPGVPEEAKAKLFNPFFTLRKEGTGLGLAIVHRIVQDHGGTVAVEDRAPRGARFTFRLPAGEGAAP